MANQLTWAEIWEKICRFNAKTVYLSKEDFERAFNACDPNRRSRTQEYQPFIFIDGVSIYQKGWVPPSGYLDLSGDQLVFTKEE